MGLLTKPFWKRIAAFFRRWWERDMRAEHLRREEAECRRKAQQEVSELCHDDIRRGNVPAPSVDSVEKAQTGAMPATENVEVSGQAAAPPNVATLHRMGSPDLEKERPQEIQNGLHGKEDQEREQR